jgi:hypothetical protein
MDSLGQFAIARDIFVIVEMELNRRMMDTQGILDAARFDDQKTHTAFGHGFIVGYGGLPHVAGRLDEGCPLTGLDDSVSGLYLPDMAGFQ